MESQLVIDLLVLEKGKSYGFQEYVFNLLNYFYMNRDEIHYNRIIIWCKDTEQSIFDKFRDKFEIAGFHFSNYLKRHWLQSWLPIKYKLGKNDLLFTPGNISGVVKCCHEVLTIHDLLYKRKEWIPSRMMRWQREVLIPISIRKADKIVAISNFTKADVEKYYPISKGKIDVIYNTMDFSKYNNPTLTDIQNDYFLAISTNYNYKNQKTIIKAFRRYCEFGGKKDLMFVGNISPESEAGIEYSMLQKEIKDRISFKSHITNEELGGLYNSASCFISASLFEGLGMPIVEAMSFGLPVLLSDTEVHREVSLGRGEYFKPHDDYDLAIKMAKVDTTKKDYNSEIHSVYSEKSTAAKYVQLFNSFAV